MGWPMVMRIWLPSWLFSRDDVVATVCERAEIASRLPRHVGERRVSTGYAAAAPPQDGQPLAGAGPQGGAGAQGGAGPQDGQPLAAARPNSAPTPAASPESYSPFIPRQEGGLSVLDGVKRRSPRHAAAVQDVMRRIVTEEGPLSEARLFLLTAQCFGCLLYTSRCV